MSISATVVAPFQVTIGVVTLSNHESNSIFLFKELLQTWCTEARQTETLGWTEIGVSCARNLQFVGLSTCTIYGSSKDSKKNKEQGYNQRLPIILNALLDGKSVSTETNT